MESKNDGNSWKVIDNSVTGVAKGVAVDGNGYIYSCGYEDVSNTGYPATNPIGCIRKSVDGGKTFSFVKHTERWIISDTAIIRIYL